MSSIYYHFTWWGSFFAVVFVFQVILNSAFTFSHPGPAELFQIWEKKSSFDLIWMYKQLSHLQVCFSKKVYHTFKKLIWVIFCKNYWVGTNPIRPHLFRLVWHQNKNRKRWNCPPKHHITVFNFDTKLIEINQNIAFFPLHCRTVVWICNRKLWILLTNQITVQLRGN